MDSRCTLPQSLYFSETIRRLEASARHEPLMQRAGAAVAAWASVLMSDRPGSILVVAGPGNNGGDAVEAARLLRQHGMDVRTVFYGQSDRLPADAAAVHRLYLAQGGTLLPAIPAHENWGLIIDGLFGIGLTRDLDDHAASWVAQINALRAHHRCPVLAIDCPSGLDADTGRLRGSAIRATHTLTFLGLKPGLLTLDGPDHCGEIRLATLAVDAPAVDADGHLITMAAFSAYLRPRLLNTHKGSFGRAYILGGDEGMLGAVFLAARAALKLGAGRVYAGLLAPEANRPRVDPLQPELMLHAAEKLLALPETANALLCGPGLGQSEAAQTLLTRVAQIDRPLVLDADALNLLAGDESLASILKKRSAVTLLTPHPAEAARLLAWPVTRIQEDRFVAVREIARRYKVCVALKGCGTLIADTQQRWQINGSGNPALATAGSGDVLSGFIVALLAQGWPGLAALTAAVHLHGLAAENWSRQTGGTTGMSAGEIIEPARTLFNAWLNQYGS